MRPSATTAQPVSHRRSCQSAALRSPAYRLESESQALLNLGHHVEGGELSQVDALSVFLQHGVIEAQDVVAYDQVGLAQGLYQSGASASV